MKRLLLVLTLSACSGQAGPRWSGTVDTLPNGAIRVGNPAEGRWGDEGGWRLVPELVLGEVDGPEAAVFGAIAALEVDREGRIYVVDRQANELRIFTRDGAHVRSAGRTGRGPGEYQNANGLVWLSPDTLIVVDQRGERYSVISRDGQYVRSVPRRLGFYGWAFAGTYVDGRVYEHTWIGRDADQRPALLGTVVAGAAMVPTEPVITDEIGGVPAPAGDTVFLPQPPGPAYEALSVRTARGGMMIGVPWAPGAVYHLDRTGDLWFGHGSAFRIVHASRGDTVMEIVLEATPAPVTAEERAEWEASESVQRFRQMGGRIDTDGLPRVKPFFTGLYVDPEGYLWATVPAGPGQTAFAVFDPDGRYLGRLQVDGIERVTWLLPVVRNDRLHFIARDELDVQRVYAFRIEK